MKLNGWEAAGTRRTEANNKLKEVCRKSIEGAKNFGICSFSSWSWLRTGHSVAADTLRRYVTTRDVTPCLRVTVAQHPSSFRIL